MVFLLLACGDGGTGPAARADYIALGVGFSHACAVQGGGALECWGDDAAFQLGTGGTRLPFCDGFDIPCATAPAAAGRGVRWRTVAGGTAFTCGVAEDGRAYCQGLNDDGQLGVNADGHMCEVAPYALRLPCRETPTPVASDARFVDVAAGGAHACALSDGGGVYCWGDNGDGQLGTGTTISSTTPVVVAAQFEAIDAGASHTCGIDTDDRLFCWGSNDEGQLGSSGGNALTPRVVLPDLRFRSVATGARHSCAVTTADATWCWGSNSTGQIGNGSSGGIVATPVTIDAPVSFRAVGAGDDHTCAITEDGALYCWGNNSSGQIGDGTREARHLPIPVTLGARVVAVEGGWRHTCALDEEGEAWCWGLNTLGMLGRGTSSGTPQPMPQRVER